jgi:hypothetical protein
MSRQDDVRNSLDRLLSAGVAYNEYVHETIERQRCSGCGGRNVAGATACEFCARPLAQPSATPAAQRRALAWWSLTILVAVVLAGAVILRLTWPLV